MSNNELLTEYIQPLAPWRVDKLKSEYKEISFTLNGLGFATPPLAIKEENPPLPLTIFKDKFLSHYLYQDGCELHDEIVKLAENDKETSVVIVAPRGFAKSTYVSLAFPLWRACEKLSKFILIVSDTAGQAEDFLREIVSELEENEELKEYYGDDISPKKDIHGKFVKWTDRDIILKSGVRISARGADNKLRGLRTKQYRPDLIIVDDLENDQHVQTKEQRKKLANWFNKALINTLDPDHGRLFIVGTIIHYDSLLKNLSKNESYTTRFFKAIKDDGTALWSTRWSLEKLAERKKKIGPHAFNSEFMNDPLDPESKPFNEMWLKYFNKSDVVEIDGQYFYQGELLRILQGIDLAISSSTKADYFVIVTIGVTNKNDVLVLEVHRKKLNFSEQVNQVIFRNKKWKPQLIYLEENGYQVALKEQVLSEQLLPIKPVKNYSDKYTRIISLTPHFWNGKIYTDKKDTDFIEEYMEYPDGAHDDQLDAFEMSIRDIVFYGAKSFPDIITRGKREFTSSKSMRGELKGY